VFASEPPPPPTRPSARGPPRGWIQPPTLATVGMASMVGGAEEAEDFVPELAAALPRHDADVLRGSVPSTPTRTRTRMRPLRRLLWRQCGLRHHHSRRRLRRDHEHEGVVSMRQDDPRFHEFSCHCSVLQVHSSSCHSLRAGTDSTGKISIALHFLSDSIVTAIAGKQWFFSGAVCFSVVRVLSSATHLLVLLDFVHSLQDGNNPII
jgi:hypothetical protein